MSILNESNKIITLSWIKIDATRKEITREIESEFTIIRINYYLTISQHQTTQ